MDNIPAIKYTVLDELPTVDSFLGLDLKTGVIIIAVLGILHPVLYCCTFYLPMSYMLVTVWILVAMYFFASALLLFGAYVDSALLSYIWTWCALFFVGVMLLLTLLMIIHFNSRKKQNHAFAAVFTFFWYLGTIYFIIVVNSHRRNLIKEANNKKLPCNPAPKPNPSQDPITGHDTDTDTDTSQEHDSNSSQSKDPKSSQNKDLNSSQNKGPNSSQNQDLNSSQNQDQNSSQNKDSSGTLRKAFVLLYQNGTRTTLPSRSSIELLVSVPDPTPTHSHSEYCNHKHSHHPNEYSKTVKVRVKTEEPPLDDGSAEENFMLQLNPEA